jgi:hypothetical protein
MLVEEVWESCYHDMVEFVMVTFVQCKECLSDHRKQVKASLEQLERRVEGIAHHHLLYPRQTHNHCEEPIFDLSIAKQFLCKDMKNKLHTHNAAFQAARN